MSELAHTNIYIGIDIGTSGVRAIAINDQAEAIREQRLELPAPRQDGANIEQEPTDWWQVCHQVLRNLLAHIEPRTVRAIALDGTSGTVLLADDNGQPLAPALMYNDARASEQLSLIRAVAPVGSPVTAITAGLPKILWLKEQLRDQDIAHIMHQADWLNFQLTGRAGISDSNNCLKTGYDPQQQHWPDWIMQLGIQRDWLPQVLSPGQPLGQIESGLARELDLNPDVLVVSGTTDSTAAIIATGAQQIGDAITSLGSTLVCKVISDKPIFASDYGIYSQPFGHHWLVGGGSNSGGAVLRQYFTDTQMQQMTQHVDPLQSSGLDYYPLPATGERFPVNDPLLKPRLTPRPDNDVQFFQGLLEGIARIEYNAYRLLHELGAPYPTSVRSVGGGAKNPKWTQIRSQLLKAPMLNVASTEAAYGSALLAKQGYTNHKEI